jgi:hypothetical protein
VVTGKYYLRGVDVTHMWCCCHACGRQAADDYPSLHKHA